MSAAPLDAPDDLPDDLNFYREALWAAMTVFPADAGRLEVEPNSIQTHPLVRYYENGWARWMN